jgi:HK97 family phage major capsid protein
MICAIHPACFARSAWVIHPSLIPELIIMLGSNGMPLSGSPQQQILQLSPQGWTMLTRPLIVSEKMLPLDSRGDIMLADFSQYAIGMRREMRYQLALEKYFESDELGHKLTCRVDGQPLWNEPLTLEDGSTTVSPFVVLAARSE